MFLALSSNLQNFHHCDIKSSPWMSFWISQGFSAVAPGLICNELCLYFILQSLQSASRLEFVIVLHSPSISHPILNSFVSMNIRILSCTIRSKHQLTKLFQSLSLLLQSFLSYSMMTKATLCISRPKFPCVCPKSYLYWLHLYFFSVYLISNS